MRTVAFEKSQGRYSEQDGILQPTTAATDAMDRNTTDRVKSPLEGSWLVLLPAIVRHGLPLTSQTTAKSCSSSKTSSHPAPSSPAASVTSSCKTRASTPKRTQTSPCTSTPRPAATPASPASRQRHRSATRPRSSSPPARKP